MPSISSLVRRLRSSSGKVSAFSAVAAPASKRIASREITRPLSPIARTFTDWASGASIRAARRRNVPPSTSGGSRIVWRSNGSIPRICSRPSRFRPAAKSAGGTAVEAVGNPNDIGADLKLDRFDRLQAACPVRLPRLGLQCPDQPQRVLGTAERDRFGGLLLAGLGGGRCGADDRDRAVAALCLLNQADRRIEPRLPGRRSGPAVVDRDGPKGRYRSTACPG